MNDYANFKKWDNEPEYARSQRWVNDALQIASERAGRMIERAELRGWRDAVARLCQFSQIDGTCGHDCNSGPECHVYVCPLPIVAEWAREAEK